MKHSPKGPQPVEFTGWLAEHQNEKNLSWESLNEFYEIKQSIIKSLRVEQGYVCAYCGRSLKIDGSDCHIEHFWPRDFYKNRTFDYLNLFASCGKKPTKNIPKTCGHAKDNWHDPNNQDLIPSHPDCERRFRYDSTGQIKPKRKDDAMASQAIVALNLDDKTLKNERREVIAGLERAIEDGEINKTTRDKEIASLRALDKEGRAKPFGHVAALYLEQELT
ncbi:TIGR02646 family protein [Azospirillum cavernae]|uniref:TIGR02646 family protein n=1 Tax=Azospirillum cavernae TaxID=2320860 RepID=A0A418VRX8_9PROT|nr:retron system putative HNH endonuclease [Azospirillum cavernae]RJF79226.1 TIGR02646 family protein [Azospirillum cavernae]